MEKTAAEFTKDIIERMKQAKQFRIIRPIPDDFEFRGPVPFDIKISNETMVFTVYATSIEDAHSKVDQYLNPYD